MPTGKWWQFLALFYYNKITCTHVFKWAIYMTCIGYNSPSTCKPFLCNWCPNPILYKLTRQNPNVLGYMYEKVSIVT